MSSRHIRKGAHAQAQSDANAHAERCSHTRKVHMHIHVQTRAHKCYLCYTRTRTHAPQTEIQEDARTQKSTKTYGLLLTAKQAAVKGFPVNFWRHTAFNERGWTDKYR